MADTDTSPLVASPPAAVPAWGLHGGAHLWHRHPAVRGAAQLTAGERAADRMRNVMGSWAFVTGALLFLGAWMAFNRGNGFDPYPFILLNLVLSCIAALQGAILLIAARRQDQISSELATDDYRTNQETLTELRTLTASVAALQEQLRARPNATG